MLPPAAVQVGQKAMVAAAQHSSELQHQGCREGLRGAYRTARRRHSAALGACSVAGCSAPPPRPPRPMAPQPPVDKRGCACGACIVWREGSAPPADEWQNRPRTLWLLAPTPHTRTFMRSMTSCIAATTSCSDTVTTSSTRSRTTGQVNEPSRASSPSQMVCGLGSCGREGRSGTDRSACMDVQ